LSEFLKLVYTPAGLRDVALAVAACRADGVGVLNAELESDSARILGELDLIARKVRGGYGVKLDAIDEILSAGIRDHAHRGLGWLILDAEIVPACEGLIADLRHTGVKVLAEIKTPRWPDRPLDKIVDGLVLKGNETGGFVGEDSSFILLQKWRKQTDLALYVRGGLTPQVAAACSAVGVAGGVLDSQVLLLEELRLPEALRSLLGNLAGNETVAVGDGEHGEYFRVLVRPGHTGARAFVTDGEGRGFGFLQQLVRGKVDWTGHRDALLPIGQDICFAGPWRQQYGRMSDVFRAIDTAVEKSLPQAVDAKPLYERAPLAEALGVRFPLVQGPMTRVSDRAEFALAVAEGGALPMVAFALLKGPALEKLLTETTRLLGERAWGIGLLGFAPQALLDEQLAIATAFHPDYAIIAGGRPDQAVRLEAAGIPTFLHVPSANLIPLFLQEGARRFIFEGRECGGHIGPLSSFVLWSTMVDRLLAELADGKVPGSEIQLLFAGGIHDAVSSAMVQVLVAPLVAKGVKIGILMGSAYLFTKEIVSTGAIVPRFQKEVIDCERTVNLESGPGHASRCAYTPFAEEFFRKREQLREKSVPADEARKTLDDLILGRLRIASKGRARTGTDGRLQDFDEDRQHRDGMYMLGQVATLRAEVTDIPSLHRQVTEDAAALLAARLGERLPVRPVSEKPVDIAIVGMASVLPKANSSREYWENILDKVDAITEIPAHRWDWRLYYDEDRTAKDKIYSKWGGFLDDMAFDPTRYGMPPKSIASVDPMQLMALEVAQRTLADAGYVNRDFDRERASIIIGASGGAGDVGTQYGLRAELPRFQGALPKDVADRLPEWTEDTFAGILINVIAGRIANRLNLGGVNFTTDAACASSLAAIYQGVSELVSGRSDFVIAGGVDTVQGPFGYLCFSKTQALSPRGRCSTFDASGDGIVISEGIAMVALKRLEDAERDGDRIYSVIKGVGGSSDGNAKGLTAPLPAGQLRAMRRAYRQAGFGPDTVELFEAHGTGTVAGDTAELESTTRLIKDEGGRSRQAAIGSVKTMIGHTKATAGIAGLIKAALALHHRVLPPHRGVNQPNKVLQQTDSPLYLIDEALPWTTLPGVPRRAAASAFGFGGTNFHVVMEEYTREYREWLRPATTRRWPAELLLWSEADREGLIGRLSELQGALASAGNIELRDLAASLAKRWRAGTETVTIVAKDTTDLAAKISGAIAWLRGENTRLPAGVHHGSSARAQGKLAILFPGQGSQYPGMLREVALHFRELADTLSEADGLLKDAFVHWPGYGVRLSHFIFPRGCYSDEAKNAAKRALTSTDVAQPALGAVEAGLLRLLRTFGLKPDMLAGHSYGEFVALHAGGALDFATLMALSAGRGRCIVEAAKAADAELGTMAAVQAPRQDVEAAIADIDDVIVANHNAPLQSIISGSRAAIAAAVAKLSKAGIEVSEIPVAAAFHSHFVKPAQGALAALIENAEWRASAIPVYSNTTAKPHTADVGGTKRLLAEHLVSPVEFVAEIEAMYQDGARLFLELGPKSVLTRLAGKILQGRPHLAIAIDDGNGLSGLLNAFAQLLCAGMTLDVMKLYDGRDCLIGDPAKPESLQRSNAVPKHAWMLNGSGVRRAADPMRQIGVTVDQLRLQPPIAQADSAAPSPAVSAPSSMTTTQSVRRKERHMAERRPTPVAGDSAIMSEYFDTMRQFLETQERVMAMFMGEPIAGRAEARLPRRAPALALSRAPDLEPASAEVHTKVPVVSEAQPSVAAAPKSAAPAAPVPAQAVSGATKPNGAGGNGAAKPDVAAKPAEHVPATAGIDRAKMTEMLLAVVEDKTGYPRDMVGLDQNLEADLGVDSIKRIEVVGAMLQKLPETYRAALGEGRSRLNTQATLNGMLNMLSELKIGGTATVPFEYAGAGAAAVVVSHPPRHTILAEQEAIEATALRQLKQGHFLITEDTLGVAQVLSRTLTGRGCTVTLIERKELGDEALLSQWMAQQKSKIPALAGIVHLAPIGAAWLAADAPLHEWRHQLQLNKKSLFMLTRDFSDKLADGAHVLSASSLGGFFNRQGSAGRGLSMQGGAPGMLKSLFEERPVLRVKAVDIDPAQTPADIASVLLAELELVGGRQEVGYPKGNRTVFHTVAISVDTDPALAGDLRGLVVLATGGARGVTAEVLRELALPGNTLVLTGRHPLPEPEPEALQALTTGDALRQHFIAEVRTGASKLTPADIHRRVQSVLAAREMLANIEDFRRGGATVEYHAVDVTNEDAMRDLLNVVYARHGGIGGVLHGAGVIEDKLLADKKGESWSRVVETKVMGLLLLQRYLRPESLKFFTVFSSVAGRYGNSGQSDYATANELMNRLCGQLRDHWGGRVKVKALCWGPWGPTKFGAGMVTAETEAKFAEKGVMLVTAEMGRRLFRDELTHGNNSTVEIICGEGPWEQREAANGEIRKNSQAPGSIIGPLLGSAIVTTLPKGDQVVSVCLDANHAYIQQHCIDGVPILPAAAALEIMAEAVCSLWRGWKVIEVRDCRLMKGVEMKEYGRKLVVAISPPPYGSSEGFEVSARLQSKPGDGKPLIHYQAVLRLEQQLPSGFKQVPQLHSEKKLTVAKAYDEWLFHGPCFQVIENIEGLSAAGARALIKGTRPANWLLSAASDNNHWLFDPAVVDAAAQMAILWARIFRDETALPTRFGRVIRYREMLPERMYMGFERIESADPNVVRANVHYADAAGQVVLSVEEMECVASAALNRLGGTARVATKNMA
jgi:acyl transferase domain-containing protein/NAD(P)H-dependent flavin oxidoreductase YrpB (nitropropane dioxygenase family)/NADP-dependent 3-hydroxy acid dehydrogenase YdfG